jgi:hypothetical protein
MSGKKTGPRIPAAEQQSCIVRTRLTPEEDQILRDAAQRREVTVSVYIRACLFAQMLGGTLEDWMPKR